MRVQLVIGIALGVAVSGIATGAPSNDKLVGTWRGHVYIGSRRETGVTITFLKSGRFKVDYDGPDISEGTWKALKKPVKGADGAVRMIQETRMGVSARADFDREFKFHSGSKGLTLFWNDTHVNSFRLVRE